MAVCRYSRRKGALLMEVLVGLSLSIIFAVAIMTLGLGSFDSIQDSRDQLAAISYAHEGLDGVRVLARQDFNLLQDGTHGLASTGNGYAFSGTSSTWGKYTQSITVAPTYRDASGNLEPEPADVGALLAAGGWEEAQMKLVTSTVGWEDSGQNKSVSLQTLVGKWFVYPLQSVVAEGALAGSDYEFDAKDGTPNVVWHSLFWNIDGGIDSVQLRSANTSADLAAAEWLGPDGTNATSYTVNGTLIHSDTGNKRWIQGKAVLTGGGTEAPLLYLLRE